MDSPIKTGNEIYVELNNLKFVRVPHEEELAIRAELSIKLDRRWFSCSVLAAELREIVATVPDAFEMAERIRALIEVCEGKESG
mgnify:FL=1